MMTKHQKIKAWKQALILIKHCEKHNPELLSSGICLVIGWAWDEKKLKDKPYKYMRDELQDQILANNRNKSINDWLTTPSQRWELRKQFIRDLIVAVEQGVI